MGITEEMISAAIIFEDACRKASASGVQHCSITYSDEYGLSIDFTDSKGDFWSWSRGGGNEAD